MTTAATAPPTAPPRRESFVSGMLPPKASPMVAGGAFVVATATWLAVGFNPYGAALTAAVVYLLAIFGWSRAVEGPRKAKDRVVTGFVYCAFAVVLVPLVSLVWTVVANGMHRIDLQFFTSDMRNIIGVGGGIKHALMGTLLITAIATLMSVPIGVLTAVGLVEYGGKGRLLRTITFLVDVMTGIPSIVAGLFAVALFTLFFGNGIHLGFGGSVALSVLMIPIVVRATEEMLRIVPHELREASYALGVPKWRTIVKIVLPTAAAGIITGVTLAVARVVGETAPLLIIAGFTSTTNGNVFSGRMMTVPVYAYSEYSYPTIPREASIDRAWSAALVLIVIVMVLNVVARLVSRYFAPQAR